MGVVYKSIQNSILLKGEVWSFWLYLVLFSLIVLSAIYTTVFAYIKLGKPGISEELRSLVFKRHVAAILIYTICNLYILATAIAVVKNDAANSGPSGNKPWKLFLKLLYFS